MSEIKKTSTANQYGLTNDELINLKEIIGQNIPVDSVIEISSISVDEKYSKSAIEKFNISSVSEPEDLTEVVYKLIENKNVVTKDRLFESKIIELKNSEKSIAIASAFNETFLKTNPEIAASIAVAEAYKKIISTGATPIALNCDIDLESKSENSLKALSGIKKVCSKFNIPLTEQKRTTKSDLPYTSIGMIGVLEDKKKKVSHDFKEKGDMIFLIGESKEDISSSEYLSDFQGVKKSTTPLFDLEDEFAHCEIIRQVVENGLVQSASAISKGGLFFSLLESAIPKNLGFDVTTDAEVRNDSYLFGEAQGRAIVTVNSAFEEDFIDFMIANNYTFSTIGHVTKGEIRVDDESFGFIKEIKEIYEYVLTK